MTSPGSRAHHSPAVFLVVALAVFLCTVPVAARGTREDDGGAELEALARRLSPADPQVTVAVGLVVAPEVPREDRPVLGSWVQVLRDTLSEVENRRLPPREVDARRAARVAAEQRRLAVEQDRLLAAAEVNRLRRRDSSADPLASLEREEALLRQLDPRTIALPDHLPVVFSRDEYLFRRTIAGPDVWREQLDVDILVYLVVEPLDDLYLVSVRMHSPWLDPKDREVTRIVAEAEQAIRQLERAAAAAAAQIAGRDLAGFTLSVVDYAGMPVSGARVFLEGDPLGFAPVTRRFVDPGEYTFSVVTDTHQEASATVVLQAGSMESVRVEIPPFDGAVVEVRTDPPGAWVYVAGKWEGTTPLSVPVPRRAVEVTLVREGFHESRITIGGRTPAVVERTLVPLSYRWEEEVESARNRMYRSLGLFVVSLAIPVVANGLYQDIGGLFPGGTARQDLSPEEQDRALQRANALFWTYYGGVALSTGLFGNMLVRIVQYVRTAGEYHDR